MNAVIDAKAFNNIRGYIDYARGSGDMTIIAGGGYDDSVGVFYRAYGSGDRGSAMQVDGGGDFRAGAHGVCVSGCAV